MIREIVAPIAAAVSGQESNAMHEFIDELEEYARVEEELAVCAKRLGTAGGEQVARESQALASAAAGQARLLRATRGRA